MATLPELIQNSLSLIGGNLNSSFNGQLSELLQQQGITMDQLWRPAIDLIETEEVLELHMNVAGVDSDSIDVDFFNNSVSIKGERFPPALSSMTGATQRRKEIIYGKFDRKIVLPISITQKESVSVKIQKGILIITIDKTVEDRNKFSMKVETDSSA